MTDNVILNSDRDEKVILLFKDRLPIDTQVKMKKFKIRIKDDWNFETITMEDACSPATAISRAYKTWKKQRREQENRRYSHLFIDVEMGG